VLLLLRFAMGDWKSQAALLPAPAADRLLTAPLQRPASQPLTVKRPTTKLR
jgi:hypothetical protein